MDEENNKAEKTAKEKLEELATKAGTTTEELVKLVIHATKDDVAFAKMQRNAADQLKQMQTSNYLLMQSQNNVMEERIRGYHLRKEMDECFPQNKQPEPPNIEIATPKIILPGQ